jgi:hypothetical protein
MQDTSQQLPALDEYVDMPKLLQITGHTFPSQDSLKWFIRQHRDDLADAGAVINITGRLRFHPERFQQAAVDICRRVAKKSA